MNDTVYCSDRQHVHHSYSASDFKVHLASYHSSSSYISHPYVPFLLNWRILYIHGSYSGIAGKHKTCISCLHWSSSFFGKKRNRHGKPGFPFQKPMELSRILFAIPLIKIESSHFQALERFTVMEQVSCNQLMKPARTSSAKGTNHWKIFL